MTLVTKTRIGVCELRRSVRINENENENENRKNGEYAPEQFLRIFVSRYRNLTTSSCEPEKRKANSQRRAKRARRSVASYFFLLVSVPPIFVFLFLSLLSVLDVSRSTGSGGSTVDNNSRIQERCKSV